MVLNRVAQPTLLTDRVFDTIHAAIMSGDLPAGTQLKVLNAELERLGLSLHNMGDIAEQTLAGAVSTGTHGTGGRAAGLAAQVVGFELVTGAGEVLHASATENADLLALGRVGLGALGVLTTLTFAVEPLFLLRAEEQPMSWEDAMAAFDDLTAAHDDNWAASTASLDCGDQGGRDAFYTFTLPAEEVVYFDSFASSFDTVIRVFAGACTSIGATQACSDDACSTTRSQGALDLPAGTYCLVLDQFSSTTTAGAASLTFKRGGRSGLALPAASGSVTGTTPGTRWRAPRPRRRGRSGARASSPRPGRRSRSARTGRDVLRTPSRSGPRPA